MRMGMRENERLSRLDTILTELCDIFVLELVRVFHLINGEFEEMSWRLRSM